MTDIATPTDQTPPPPPNNSRVVQMFVTPHQAKEWKNATEATPEFRQRHREANRVRAFRQLLRDDQLDLITDEIGISPEGWIINGQHRLEAVILEDKGAWFAVRFDLPVETFSRIDTGWGRSASTILDIAGYPNFKALAALAKLAHDWTMGRAKFASSRFSNDETLAFVRERPELAGTQPRDPVPYGQKWGTGDLALTPRFVALFAWLTLGDDSGFLPALVEDNGESTDPTSATMLRKTYATRAARGDDKDYRKTVGLFIKARNVWGGELPRRLTITDQEEFPMPAGWTPPIAFGAYAADDDD